MASAPEIVRWAKYTVEAWTDPEQFATPEEFLQAITETLDNLAVCLGKTHRPDLDAVWR